MTLALAIRARVKCRNAANAAMPNATALGIPGIRSISAFSLS
ncbi:hypothetical protein LuPra_06098 [Luteitalea pratensis]|uniref:Uncharacterized protein n=1 Tax=Luteitalea pratensis TaxID=1855912 RepID=A0A143PX44_LUTPR|nr:hypothetical protein LuPra_06098 [Luteitalea pratensis]